MIDHRGHKILIADDDLDIQELLRYNLEAANFSVRTASNGLEVLKIADYYDPDLIILDIMMPLQDGIETCRILRGQPKFKDTYIIFLTARSEEYSEVAAFENGANDYLVKPIKPRALKSRIDAIFRQIETKINLLDDSITLAGLSINKSTYTINYLTEEYTLPKKEFEVIYLLIKHPGKVFTREELLDKIWGVTVEVTSRTVDVHIRKIREKIDGIPIKTIKGVGYKFNA
jgi:two-component system alkaline phosphatase synthesis response regulator PhoP